MLKHVHLMLDHLQLVDVIMVDGKVAGVKLCKTGKPEQEETLPCQAVILATGGYSASKEVLKVCVCVCVCVVWMLS